MDFTDAVLARYPQIDRKRLAVTGGSYGGFMTNWIIGHTDRLACAASQRSISNWLSFYGVSDIGYRFATDQCDGNPSTAPEQLCSLPPALRQVRRDPHPLYPPDEGSPVPHG